MYRVFLAGGIASGKSTVAQLMEQRGAVRIDLDAISHELLAPSSPILAQIADRFGQDLIGEGGELKRGLLAQRVFASHAALADLEAIEHPAIFRVLVERLSQLDCTVAVVEIPLVNKAADVLPLADEIVSVVADMDVRRARALRRGLTEEDFALRVKQQISDSYLITHSDTVITNNGSEQDLERAVEQWWLEREQRNWTLPQGGFARV